MEREKSKQTNNNKKLYISRVIRRVNKAILIVVWMLMEREGVKGEVNW
jgi:hypothetical protein